MFKNFLPALGVSVHNGLKMNSLCVQRKAGEAVGAITHLEKSDGSNSMTVNVEVLECPD